MNQEEKKYYNALNVLYKCSYTKLKKAEEYFNTWKEAWESEGNRSVDVDNEWAKLEKLGILVVLKKDSTYPEYLKEISSPPFGLYVLGDLNYSHPSIAVVGTRAATPKGREYARDFAFRLGDAGFSIISGLAMGVDEQAHKGALETNGKTIAVLGTALDNIYPKQNLNLADKILKSGGAIISEFPLGQSYYPQNFLVRNRIISGLVRGILVIEAPERSGSLATARFALDQNKDIFVIPGDINSKNYEGSNNLLKDGASLVTNVKDIFDYYGVEEKSKNSLSEEIIGNDGIILKTLKNNNGQLTIDKLSEITSINVEDLNKNLAMLIIKGIIKEINGTYLLS